MAKMTAKLAVAALLAGAAFSTGANALTISVKQGNLVSFEYDVDEALGTIGIEEVWGPTSGNVQLLFSDITPGKDYRVYKVVHNDTGKTWGWFQNELLHADGSWSNDADGLSFAQGSGIDRTSTNFSVLTVDELNLRDYLKWSGAPYVESGHFNVFEFGLRDNLGDNNPFILAQTVPEPASWALMIVGFGMIGAAMRRRQTVVTA